MFEKYMIVPEKAKNVEKDGKIIGYQFGARIPYYRGLGVSMVQGVGVSIDEQEISPEAILFTVGDGTFTLKEMEDQEEARWEMGEVALITVLQDGGLNKGDHLVDLLINLRISYLPFPAIRKAIQKTITI